MLGNKLQRTTATIAIGFALLATAVPAANATKKGPKHHDNAAAKRQLCQDLRTIMEGNQDEAQAQWEAGNAAAASEADSNATKAYDDARHQGCGWAARVAPPQTGPPTGEAPMPDGPLY